MWTKSHTLSPITKAMVWKKPKVDWPSALRQLSREGENKDVPGN